MAALARGSPPSVVPSVRPRGRGGGGGWVGGHAGKTKFVCVQWASQFWLPIQDFIFPQTKGFLVLGGGWLGLGGGGSARSPPPPPLDKHIPAPHPPRDALERGEVTPPPLQGAQPMPSHRLPGAQCQPQWHNYVTDSNRPQPLGQPPPTACLPASGAASEVPSILMHPCPPPTPPQVHVEAGEAHEACVAWAWVDGRRPCPRPSAPMATRRRRRWR